MRTYLCLCVYIYIYMCNMCVYMCIYVNLDSALNDLWGVRVLARESPQKIFGSSIQELGEDPNISHFCPRDARLNPNKNPVNKQRA